jgi:hypothetical protein
MRAVQEPWPRQPRAEYARRVLRFAGLLALGEPHVYGMFVHVGQLAGLEVDASVNRSVPRSQASVRPRGRRVRALAAEAPVGAAPCAARAASSSFRRGPPAAARCSRRRMRSRSSPVSLPSGPGRGGPNALGLPGRLPPTCRADGGAAKIGFRRHCRDQLDHDDRSSGRSTRASAARSASLHAARRVPAGVPGALRACLPPPVGHPRQARGRGSLETGPRTRTGRGDTG